MARPWAYRISAYILFCCGTTTTTFLTSWMWAGYLYVHELINKTTCTWATLLCFSLSPTHTHATGMLDPSSLFAHPAAFIHTLQQLTEDSNGVLWAYCNSMPSSNSGMPVYHQTVTHPSVNWEHIRDLISSGLVASEEQVYQCGPAYFCTASSVFTWVFRKYLPSVFQTFSFFLNISLCSFLFRPHSALLDEQRPEGQLQNRHQSSFSCFCSHSVLSSPLLTRNTEQSSASREHINQCWAKCSLDKWGSRCRIHP